MRSIRWCLEQCSIGLPWACNVFSKEKKTVLFQSIWRFKLRFKTNLDRLWKLFKPLYNRHVCRFGEWVNDTNLREMQARGLCFDHVYCLVASSRDGAACAVEGGTCLHVVPIRHTLNNSLSIIIFNSDVCWNITCAINHRWMMNSSSDTCVRTVKTRNNTP